MYQDIIAVIIIAAAVILLIKIMVKKVRGSNCCCNSKDTQNFENHKCSNCSNEGCPLMKMKKESKK